MKKHILVNLLIAAVLLLTTACSSNGGTPLVLTVGSSELTLGEFRPSTLSGEDFEIGVPGGGLPIGNMPGSSWMSGFLTAAKDHHSYAYLYIYNPKKEEVPYIGATVYKIDLNMDKDDTSFWSDDSILVNGTNFYGMDADGVKTAMADYKLNNESDTHLSYKDGKYSYSFSIGEEGTVEKVSLEMQIPKSYSSK